MNFPVVPERMAPCVFRDYRQLARAEATCSIVEVGY